MTQVSLEENLATVLIPNFNGAKYIAKAISSALAQNYKCEIVIVDNNSNDESLRIIQNLQKKHLEIKLYSEREKGISNALNLGISRIATKYIIRLDSDDTMEPNRVLRQVDYLERNQNCVLVSSQIRHIDENDLELMTSKYTCGQNIAHKLASTNPIAHPASAFVRAAAVNSGGYRNRFNGAEDLDLWFRLAAKGDIAVIDDELTNYRDHTEQATKSNLYGKELLVRLANFYEFIIKQRRFSLFFKYILRIIFVAYMHLSFGKLQKSKKLMKKFYAKTRS